MLHSQQYAAISVFYKLNDPFQFSSFSITSVIRSQEREKRVELNLLFTVSIIVKRREGAVAKLH